MVSHCEICKFQPISPVAAYNIINARNQRCCLVFLDMRLRAQTPFPTAVLPPPALTGSTSDLDIVISCLRGGVSSKKVSRRSVVLFIEEHRLAAIENDMAIRLCDSSDQDFVSLATEWEKFCCFDIDKLFQYVPSRFISAALTADQAPRVPSLIECLLPLKLFLCERKLVRQALDPISGLGISSVLNVTANAAVCQPGITHNFPIEDSIECDVAAGAPRSPCAPRDGATARNCILAVCTQTRPLLKELLGKQDSVLVHCVAGVSRSGSVVIDFAMHALSLDYQAAKALVRRSRPEVRPNAAFERQLDKCPRWGLDAMEMLGQCIAKLKFQVARNARDQSRSNE